MENSEVLERFTELEVRARAGDTEAHQEIKRLLRTERDPETRGRMLAVLMDGDASRSGSLLGL